MTLAYNLEDDTFSAMALNMLLEDEGLTVKWYSDADAAVAGISEAVPDILIADWQVEGGTSSADVARLIRARNPSALVMFVTGYSPQDLYSQLRDLEPYHIFPKPLDYDEFLGWIRDSKKGGQ